MSNEINHAAECAEPAQPPSLRERLMRRLFPARHLAAPEPTDEFPNWIRHEVYILADWKDRLRVLVSGRLRVTVFVEVETDPGATRTKTAFWVSPPPGWANNPLAHGVPPTVECGRQCITGPVAGPLTNVPNRLFQTVRFK